MSNELDFGTPTITPLEFLTTIGSATATKSMYDIWVESGGVGEPADFLNWLKGVDGLSAYQIWIALGNEGTELEMFQSFNGDDGTIVKQSDDATSTGTISILPNTDKNLTTVFNDTHTFILTPIVPTSFANMNQSLVTLTMGLTEPNMSIIPPTGVTFQWMGKESPSALTVSKAYDIVFSWVSATKCRIYYEIES